MHKERARAATGRARGGYVADRPGSSALTMHVLVLTSEPVGAGDLSQALGESVTPEETEVMVVAPALHEDPLKFWLSDADEAIARADKVRRETLRELEQAGVAASADTGESEPLTALEDALRTFPADRIVVFKHPDSQQRYREDFDVAELEQRFGVPLSEATVRAAD